MDMKKLGGLSGRLAGMAAEWEKHGTIDPIERDIALGLLRELYTELRFAEPEPRKQEAVPEAKQEPSPVSCPVPESQAEILPEPVPETKEAIVPEPHKEGLPEPEPVPERESEPVRAAEEPAVAAAPPVMPRRVDPEVIRSLYGDEGPAQPAPRREQAKEPAAEPAPEKKSAGSAQTAKTTQAATLGDVMNAGRQTTLGETLRNGDKDMASKIAASECPDLKRAIGLNDKFLMIRDMFDGDARAFEETIAHLDTFTDLDDAAIYIHDNYNWNADSDGVKLLVELLERKLG